jgi:hypothetical protein
MLLFKIIGSKFSAVGSKSRVKLFPYYVKPKIPPSFVQLHILGSILSQHAYNHVYVGASSEIYPTRLK